MIAIDRVDYKVVEYRPGDGAEGPPSTPPAPSVFTRQAIEAFCNHTKGMLETLGVGITNDGTVLMPDGTRHVVYRALNAEKGGFLGPQVAPV